MYYKSNVLLFLATSRGMRIIFSDWIILYISLAGNHNVLEDILWTKYFHLYANKCLEFQIAEESGVENRI